MNFESHPSLGAGMVRDVQRHLLDNAFYDAVNVIVDVDGKARKRGGVLSVSTGQDMLYNVPQWMLAFASGDYDDVRVLYCLQEYPYTSAVNYGLVIIPRNGTPRLGPIGGSPRILGRPFRFGRYCCFPQFTTNTAQLPAQIYHGTWATSFVNFSGNALAPGGGSVTQNSNIVTFNAVDRPGLGYGDWLTIPSSPAGTTYSSVITSLTPSTTTCTMDHPVGFTDATVDIDLSYIGPGSNTIYGSIVGSKTGAAFQNRIVYGDVLVKDGTTFIHATNGLAWSSLPTEVVTFGGVTYSGFQQHVVVADNFLRVPDVTRIVGLSPVGPSQLLILAPERCIRLAGNLATISSDNQSLPVDLQPISTTVGCISDRSIQETSYGVIWASADGVYLYDGSELRNLMEGRLVTYWDQLQDSTGFEIQGSAIIRGDHYVLSTTAAKLLLNIPLGAWTRLDDRFDVSCSTFDPAEPTRIFGARWRSPASDSDDHTSLNQSIFRIDTLLHPTPTNPADYQGNNVEATLESQAYVMGDPARLKRLRRTTVVADVKAHTNLATYNPGLELEVHLPNGNAEDPGALTRWWRGTNATVTTSTAQQHDGRASIQFVTTAINGGTIYDLPVGYFDAGTIWSVECYVRLTTAGTVTLTFNGGTATTTTVGSWVRLVVANRVAASADVINLTAQITHSANAATVHVDDLRLFDLRPFQRSGATVGLAACTTDFHTGTASLEITAPATLGAGSLYLLPVRNADLTMGTRANDVYVGSVWAKSTAGATDWRLELTDGTTVATANFTAISSWKQFSVTWTGGAATTQGLSLNVGRASAATGTLLVDDFSIVNSETAFVDVAVIGGLEAEGDYGDGLADDDAFANFTRDYNPVSNPGAWAASGGQLVPGSASTLIAGYQRGATRTRDGEAILSWTPGHASDRAGLVIDLYDANNYLMFETLGGGVSSIRKAVAGVLTSFKAGTGATVVLGVTYWMRAVRIGNYLRVEHYTGDPALGYAPVSANTVEWTLSSSDATLFTNAGMFGMRVVPGDTTMRVEAFRCQPYDSLGQYVVDPSGPAATRRTGAILTRAATYRYRSHGACGEAELGGLNFEYLNLRPGRTT